MGTKCPTEDFALFIQTADLMGDFANNGFKRGSKGEICVRLWQYGWGGGERANSLAGNTKGGEKGGEAAPAVNLD